MDLRGKGNTADFGVHKKRSGTEKKKEEET